MPKVGKFFTFNCKRHVEGFFSSEIVALSYDEIFKSKLKLVLVGKRKVLG